MFRLPWREQWWQIRCKARLDNGTRCQLIQHDAALVGHAARDGEVVIRWGVLQWTERALDHREGPK